MNRTSFRLPAAGSFLFSAMMALAVGQRAASNASPELDYDYFKAKVEPAIRKIQCRSPNRLVPRPHGRCTGQFSDLCPLFGYFHGNRRRPCATASQVR